MTLNFTVEKVENYMGLPEGKYTAQVKNVEYIQGDYGNYHIVDWEVLNPSEFEGKVHQERFSTEHDNEKVRNIAKQSFSRFCMEIGQAKISDNPKEDDFLYKIADITLRSKEGKDGKVYTNVIKRELVEKQPKRETASSIIAEHEALKSVPVMKDSAGVQHTKTELNDEIPF